MKNRIAFLFIPIVIIGCGVDLEKVQQFIMHSDNKLMHTKIINDVTYKMVYVPSEIMAFQESRGSKQLALKVLNEMNNQDFYLLEITHKNIDQLNSKSDHYYAYNLQNDIGQILGKDTISPTNYHLEPTLTGRHKMRMNISFKAVEKDRKLIINDQYGAGVEFIISQDAIDEIPNLRF